VQEKKKLLPQILTVLIIAMLLILVGITSVAAQSSLPGDALYSLKTTIEQTRLSISQDSGSRAELKMHFAEERLAEIESLIEEGRYSEVGDAVLAFESAINGAIIELETLAEFDPARASKLALDITAALTSYAQTLSMMAANAPDPVQETVSRALDSALVAGSLEMPSEDDNFDDALEENEDDSPDLNSNDNDSNVNEDDLNSNSSLNDNTNEKEDSFNSNSNSNVNEDDYEYNDNANSNDNDIDDVEEYNYNSNSNSDDNEDNYNYNSNSNNSDDNEDDYNYNSNNNDNDDENNHNSNSNENESEVEYDKEYNDNVNSNFNTNDNLNDE
jgi:hypothetical protein